MYSAIEHFVNMALYKCCILFIIIIYQNIKMRKGSWSW